MSSAGVNVVGYLDAESGLGEVARGVIATLAAAGIPFSTTVWTRTSARRGSAYTAGDGQMHPVTIACVNADNFDQLVVAPEPTFRDTYRIAVWAWETEVVPRFMSRIAPVTDEIWTLSHHSARAIRSGTSVPTYVFNPPVVRIESAGASAARRPGLSFLFAFDFLSIVERKNPAAVIDAFCRAFTPGEAASLTLKSVNGDRRPAELEALRAAAAGRSEIAVVDGYLNTAEHRAMIDACDVYVSLHRAEGYGLTLAEAMAQGKPVIATAYSGNLDFMTERNSCLVPYVPTPIPDDCFLYPPGTPWAEPEVAEAARLMRRLYEAPELARSIGETAAADFATNHTPEARVGFVRARVAHGASIAPVRHTVPLFLRPEVRRLKSLLRAARPRRPR
ncbi:MAG TPA: glycosyltransferase [Acidimicrobiales bacterium]|nr:glycosyltransferase [Acidimicrobiales bacterium]